MSLGPGDHLLTRHPEREFEIPNILDALGVDEKASGEDRCGRRGTGAKMAI